MKYVRMCLPLAHSGALYLPATGNTHPIQSLPTYEFMTPRCYIHLMWSMAYKFNPLAVYICGSLCNPIKFWECPVFASMLLSTLTVLCFWLRNIAFQVVQCHKNCVILPEMMVLCKNKLLVSKRNSFCGVFKVYFCQRRGLRVAFFAKKEILQKKFYFLGENCILWRTI